MTVKIACFKDSPKEGIKAQILDVGAVMNPRSLLATILPIMTDLVILIQVVDIKALYLALEGTDQAMFVEVLKLVYLPKLVKWSHLQAKACHNRIYWLPTECLEMKSHSTEEAEALRFFCAHTGMKANLPSLYWEEDCRYLIENLKYEEAKELVENEDIRIDVNTGVGYNEKSNFHLAVERGSLDLVMAMLKHRNVLINHTNQNGYTALHFAVYFDYPQVVLALLEHGADVNLKTRHMRDTPLHLAARYQESDCVLPLLMQKGIRVNETNKRNQTPLDRALFYQHVDAKHPFVAEVRTVEQLFPPNYLERHAGLRHPRSNSKRSWWRPLLKFNTEPNVASFFKGTKEIEATENSDKVLLEALAAAAAEVDTGKGSASYLNIPVTASPGLSPLRLPAIDEGDEEHEESEGRHLVTLEMIRQRKVLRNIIDQLRSCEARSMAEIVAMTVEREEGRANAGSYHMSGYTSMWEWFVK